MLVPYLLTLAFIALGLSITLLLARDAWRVGISADTTAKDATDAAAMPIGHAGANRWLRAARSLFLFLLLLVLGFHSYWVFWADAKGSPFSKAKVLDARNRRLAESGLKGWVLDRSGKLENALIRYRFDGKGLVREYPLGSAAVHVTGFSGFVFGSGGLEAAYADWLTQAASTYNRFTSPFPVGKDLRVSLDSELQREAFNLLKTTGRPGGAVVLGLPTNEVLAMASTPSFEPGSIQDEDTWRTLAGQAEDPTTQPLSPLVNRALGTLVSGGPAFYYRPGSTFKAFVAAVALDTGVTGERFTCKGEGFTPPGASRPIRDYGGEVHGTIGLKEAFVHSCNQYFAQLGLKLGKQRLAEYARRLKYLVDPGVTGSRDTTLWQVLHGDQSRFDFVFAMPSSRMNVGRDATAYDVALESFGQGFDDFTVMSMALLASVAASADGSLAAPTLEANAPRKVISPFISAHSAAELRELMRSVVVSGTAAGIFNPRMKVAGKTGTADRDVLVYDNQGRPVTETDSKGKAHLKTRGSTDSWFIGFAPSDKPRIAFAIMIENGGQGAKTAAPVASKLIQKASALGLLEDELRARN